MDKFMAGSAVLLILRVIMVYFVVLIVMRLMGKREIGKLSIFDLVVSIMIAEVSAVALEQKGASLVRGLLIIACLCVLQILMSLLSLKSNWVRKIIDGKATILIVNGKINEREMKRTRYSLRDLMTQLREKDIFTIADVEFAVLETTGKLSVVPKAEKKPLTPQDVDLKVAKESMPIPLIMEGKPIDRNLERLEKSRYWLKRQIVKAGYKEFQDIFFCSIDHNSALYIDGYDAQELKTDIDIIKDL